METKKDLVKCPYCGGSPVMGKLVTTYSYVSEHCLREDGIDIEDKGDWIGAMLGDMNIEPTMKITNYKCLSCKKSGQLTTKKNTNLLGAKMDCVILKGKRNDGRIQSWSNAQYTTVQ